MSETNQDKINQAKDVLESVAVFSLGLEDTYVLFQRGSTTVVSAANAALTKITSMPPFSRPGRVHPAPPPGTGTATVLIRPNQAATLSMVNPMATGRAAARASKMRVFSAAGRAFINGVKGLAFIARFSGLGAAVMGIWALTQPSETDQIMNKLDELSGKIDTLGDRLEEKLQELQANIVEQLHFLSYDDAIARIVHAEQIMSMSKVFADYFVYESFMACDNIVENIFLNGTEVSTAIYTTAAVASANTTVVSSLSTEQQTANTNATNALANWQRTFMIRAKSAATNATVNTFSNNTLTLVMPFVDGPNTLILKAKNTFGPAALIASLRGCVTVNGLQCGTLINTVVNGTGSSQTSNWRVAPATATDAPPDKSSSVWVMPTFQANYGGGQWGTRVAGMPSTDATWLWASTTSDNQYVWLKCEFDYDANTLVNSLQRSFAMMDRTNIVGFNVDDLEDDLFRIMVNAITQDNGLKDGTLEMIYKNCHGRPSILFAVANSINGIILRAIRVLTFLNQRQAEEQFLIAHNVLFASELNATQQAEFDELSYNASAAILNLLQNQASSSHNLLEQFSQEFLKLVNQCGTSENMSANVQSSVISFVNTNAHSYPGNNQGLATAIYNHLNAMYVGPSKTIQGVTDNQEVLLGLPALEWLVIVYDSPTPLEVQTRFGTGLFFHFNCVAQGKTILVATRSRVSTTAPALDASSCTAVQNSVRSNTATQTILYIADAVATSLGTTAPYAFLITHEYFDDPQINLAYAVSNTAVAHTNRFYLSGRTTAYLLFG